MKPLACLIFALLFSHSVQVVAPPTQLTVVLPSPELLRCATPECQQVWHAPASSDAIYPHQVAIDFDHGCVYGLTAYYDETVPLEAVKAALDEKYGEWESRDASRPDLIVGRVEPMKFAIMLFASSKRDEKRYGEVPGTINVLYTAFGGRKACASK